MTADTTAAVHRTSSPRTFTVVELTIYLRLAMTALFAVTAVFVVSRRLAGALATPLGLSQLLVAGLLLGGLAWGVHAPIRRGRFPVGDVLVSLAVLVLAASLSLPGSNAAALFGFWAMIVGEELWTWRRMLPARLGVGWAKRAAPNGLPITPFHDAAPADRDLSEQREPAEPGADVLQQLTLRSTVEGGQELSGWLRMPLVAGQRNGSLHVAFCPPFGQMPQVEAEAVGGPDCRIKAAQVLPYRARLDVKLDEPAMEGEGVLVRFFACSQR